MIYNINYETDFTPDFNAEEIYRKVVDCVTDYFDCPYDCEINLIITDDTEIRDINKNTRGIDKSTDVLSFPNIDFDEPGDFEGIDDTEDVFEPDSGELILGDIVISKDRIISQAEEYGHSLLREYAFLICHSMLHLIGFDHIEDDDRVQMEEMQSIIMERLNIQR